jgi:hypothetical protein
MIVTIIVSTFFDQDRISNPVFKLSGISVSRVVELKDDAAFSIFCAPYLLISLSPYLLISLSPYPLP